MKLLSKELVSLDYREHLQRDLSRATVCRFLVAYVSNEGLASIGRHLLNQALRNERSFGLASLTCSCGFEPLVRLQSELAEVRLKYFMDPLVKEDDEPSEIALFHSKVVYLHLEREGKSVVYIGSHNWSRRALGPQGPRNAEASIRFELDYSPEHLEGVGDSVASHANRHLLDAWNMPLCLPATANNEPTFREWFEKGCRRQPATPLSKSTILLAVRKPAGGSSDWLNLKGRGIYLQVLEEEDGHIIWDSNNRLLLLVWESDADLAAAAQPVILQCRITTSKAGRDSRLRGTNQSIAPVAGFEAVTWDETELAAQQGGGSARRPRVRLWSGREVQVYDFEYPTQHSDSSQIDGSVRPKYQFHLEVARVIAPASGRFSDAPEYAWAPETFSVAESRDAARVEETPGYCVDADSERRILECLEEILFVDTSKAKVLPYSSADRAKVGKRVSTHPLHETYLGLEWREAEHRDSYYQRTEAGALVADLDSQHRAASRIKDDGIAEHLPRLQRVFTTPIDKLVETWSEAAKMLWPDKRDKDASGEKEQQ